MHQARPSEQLTDVERRALDAVDVPAMVELLREMVAVPSITGTPAESELQHQLAARLERAKLDVDLWQIDLDEVRQHPGYPGEEAPRDEGWGLVATTPVAGAGGDEPALVLCGHVDVVPPGDLDRWPDRDPWLPRVSADTVFGRGSCDMKAGVAANIMALTALREAGIRLRRPVAIHCVVSEEDGGLGTFATLVRGHRGDGCVITEPTGGYLVSANAGALTFRLEVPGRATHGSTRWLGHSALDAYLPVHQALRDLEAKRNADTGQLFGDVPLPYGLSVGIVQVGDWSSSVPDLLVAEGRYGVRLGEDPDAARSQFEAHLAEACAADPWLSEHPARVSWPGGQFGSGQTEPGHPFIDRVSAAVANVVGQRPIEQAAPYGSDLRLYVGMGEVPTVQYGPGEPGHAHSPEERVSIAAMTTTCQALVLTVLRSCGVR